MRVALVCVDSQSREYARYINGRLQIRTRLADGEPPLTRAEIEDFRNGGEGLIMRDPPEAA